MIIAGIGSRDTPLKGLNDIKKVAAYVVGRDGWIRSGHAEGADTAFEQAAGDRCIVYVPWGNFGNKYHTQNIVNYSMVGRDLAHKAMTETSKYHPAWDNLKQSIRKLMARNWMQIYGTRDVKVDAVVCWARTDKKGDIMGGTGQACRIAQAAGIPIYNLYNMSAEEVIGNLERIADDN